MSDKNKGGKRLIDLILIAALLAVSLSALLITWACSSEGKFVRVYVDNEAVGDYSLSEEGEFPLNGGTNVLRIENGRACVISADCPRQTCVNQGWVSMSYEKIICAENKVMVEVRD